MYIKRVDLDITLEKDERNQRQIMKAAIEFTAEETLFHSDILNIRNPLELQMVGEKVRSILYDRILDQIQPMIEFEEAFNTCIKEALEQQEKNGSAVPAILRLKRALNLRLPAEYV